MNWKPIEVAPLSESIIIASKCGRVGEGYVYEVNQASKRPNETIGERKALLAVPNSWGDTRVTPIAWAPLPIHPRATLSGKSITKVIVDDHYTPKQPIRFQCYGCHEYVTWLAPDSRCSSCTRLSPDEV